jgi:hypothetical protein
MKISKPRLKKLVLETVKRVLKEEKTVKDYDAAAKKSLGLPDDFPVEVTSDGKYLAREKSGGSEAMARSNIQTRLKKKGLPTTGKPYKALDDNLDLAYLYMLVSVSQGEK